MEHRKNTFNYIKPMLFTSNTGMDLKQYYSYDLSKICTSIDSCNLNKTFINYEKRKLMPVGSK